MARRGILKAMTAESRDKDPEADREADFSNHAGVTGMRSSLKDLTSRAYQEIDPSLVDESAFSDRFEIEEEALAALAESLRKHGQRIPALVRPAATPGRYIIVYGRRRLAAARRAGLPLKAFVQPLGDEDAILAQGQENSFRSDPTFIERAMFVKDLEAAGHDSELVRAALDISKPALSHMRAVSAVFSAEIVHNIGNAPDFGWKRWYALARKISEHRIDPTEALEPSFDEALTSNDRMQEFCARIDRIASRGADAPPAPPSPVVVTDAEGCEIGSVLVSNGSARIVVAGKGQPGFVDWLKEHGAEAIREMHARWRSASGAAVQDHQEQPSRKETDRK